jgi:hypothetical protein
MIWTTSPLSHRGFVTSSIALIAVIGAASQLPASEPSDHHHIPVGSLGYVHVQVTELDESPLFDTISRLQSHVQVEATAFSLARIGLDATTVSELTFLFPSLDTCVLIATLTEPFERERLYNRLTAGLRLTPGANNMLTNGHDQAIFVASDHTVVMGSPASIDWWLSARNSGTSSRLTASRVAAATQGQILAGFDATQVPKILLAQLPAPIQTLSKASVATGSVTLGDGMGINASLTFDDEVDAERSSQELNALVEQGRASLSALAAKLVLDNKNPNASAKEGLEALAMLALVREGAAHLAQVRIEHANAQVSAEASVDLSMVLFGLTAIRSVGTHPNTQLQSDFQKQAVR